MSPNSTVRRYIYILCSVESVVKLCRQLENWSVFTCNEVKTVEEVFERSFPFFSMIVVIMGGVRPLSRLGLI